ncbi:unnamed protein product [Orchesella dallaii]|uniref:Uncharacterized protein n=1 Tax=Orchesella dallaii TaxID=48710 RepID=A0ABP1RS18_9HEXA
MERGGSIGIILGVLLLNCVSSAYIPQLQPSETNFESSTTVGSFTDAVNTKGTQILASDGTLATTYEATTASPVVSSSSKGIQEATTSGTTTLLTPKSADKRITTAGASTISLITDMATTTFNATTDAHSLMDSLDKKGEELNMKSHELQMTTGGADDMDALKMSQFLLKLFYKLTERHLRH